MWIPGPRLIRQGGLRLGLNASGEENPLKPALVVDSRGRQVCPLSLMRVKPQPGLRSTVGAHGFCRSAVPRGARMLSLSGVAASPRTGLTAFVRGTLDRLHRSVPNVLQFSAEGPPRVAPDRAAQEEYSLEDTCCDHSAGSPAGFEAHADDERHDHPRDARIHVEQRSR